jgi:GNAT superfamily N-acetyltransferase
LLYIEPQARRRGLGARLLAAAASRAGKPLRVLNIDTRAVDVAAFLEAAGATRTVRQLEMICGVSAR